MKTLHSSDVWGKALSTVYLCSEGWKQLKTKTRVPDKTKLFNFEVVAGGRHFLVLDNYGDEILPAEVMKRLMGMELFAFNLAIDRKDGGLYTVQFVKEGTKYAMTTARLEHGEQQEHVKLPKKFLGRIDELTCKKRPYFLTCWEHAVWAMISQETGFANLRDNIVVDFDFDRRRVQVWGESYREVSKWMLKWM